MYVYTYVYLYVNIYKYPQLASRLWDAQKLRRQHSHTMMRLNGLLISLFFLN